MAFDEHFIDEVNRLPAAGGRADHRVVSRPSLSKIWMRGGFRAGHLRRLNVKFFRGSNSWKEGGLLPPPFPIGRPGFGREGANFTTRPRAAMMIRRRTADSAGQRTRSTALWTERGIRETAAS